MVEKNQQFIFNSNELSLLKNTFAENEPLLYTLRKVFLQFDLSKDEIVHLKSAINADVVDVLKKRILPDLSADYPLGQIPSMMTTLTDELRSLHVEEMEPRFKAKVMEEAYLNQQFTALEAILADKKIPDPEIVLKELGQLAGKDAGDAYVEMTAYLFLLGYVDPMFIMIRAIAGEKEETLDQQKERMTRNSNQ
jgi:hypothetical protein